MKNNPNSGQAIVEILAAFVLLAFLLSGLVVAGLYAIKSTQYARNKSQATKLASQQMERVRVKRDIYGIGVFPSCGVNSCFLNPQLTFGPTDSTGIFTQSLKIVLPTSGTECPTPTGAVVTVYKAIVDVRWDNIPNATPPRQVELNSCFSNWRQ